MKRGFSVDQHKELASDLKKMLHVHAPRLWKSYNKSSKEIKTLDSLLNRINLFRSEMDNALAREHPDMPSKEFTRIYY